MKYLWKLEKGFLKEVVEQFPQPRPAYTTIATVLSRMVNKGYIGFSKCGRDKEYYPILKRDVYFSKQVKNTIKNFFDNSTAQFASFFTKNSELSLEQLQELEALIKKQISDKQKKAC